MNIKRQKIFKNGTSKVISIDATHHLVKHPKVICVYEDVLLVVPENATLKWTIQAFNKLMTRFVNTYCDDPETPLGALMNARGE